MLFKYRDTVDGNFAFIISDDEETARKALENETTLPVLMVGSRSLEDFPHASEHWYSCYDPIYINNIIPF